MRRSSWFLAIAPISVLGGVAWMATAVGHFLRWRELRWLPLVGLWTYHLIALLLFGAAVTWVGINVTGVFI